MGGAAHFALVLAGLCGAGAPVTRLVFPPLRPAVFFPAALACGLTAVAMGMHGLGLAGLWFRPVLLAGAAGAVAAGAAWLARARPWTGGRVPAGARLPLAVAAFGLA